MYISIKYKYIIIYSILTIFPIIMFHIWISQISSEKLFQTISGSYTNLVKQLSFSLALIKEEQNGKLMNDLFANSGLDLQSEMLIVDYSGTLIYTSNVLFADSHLYQIISSKLETNDQFITEFNGKETLVTYAKEVISKRYLIVFTPTKVIYDQFSSMNKLIIVLILISIILSLFSIILISFHLTSPIRILRKKLESLENGQTDTLDEQEVILKDEIWQIGISFNLIVSKLSKHMDLQYQLKIRSNQAKLLALQSQINPHFLHNTLETINSIALIKKVPLIAQLSRSLSKMFRYNTIEGKKYVTLKEEIEHTENYLNVQLIRFDGIINSKFDINPNLLANRTIKFILQPIVENCFNHGFKDLDEQGLILIRAFKENERLIICIEDNGEGIDTKQLIRINESLQNPIFEEENQHSSSTGIGLSNVNTRIKIAFGQEYGLVCNSLSPHGLSVVITLPFNIDDKEE